ncbi:MAG: putative two-component system histidine kinase [Friedmanniella sp.]|nr:putative two-component system histidine kinase [Friedmanniella sp.]
MPAPDPARPAAPPRASTVESAPTRHSRPVEDGPDAQSRLRQLLAANRVISSELSLPGVLRRIVEAAREVGGARYAALGVIGPDGTLEQFVHSGMDADVVAAIGHLPQGLGVLGAVIAQPQPIRLAHIADDPRSSGFPPGHPPMESFLGVPVRSKGSVYGNLYLADRTDGGTFTAQDEELMLALAGTAGIAIENARLYDESRRRQEWLRASGEVSRHLLAGGVHEVDVLRRITDSVQRLANADVVTLVRPRPSDGEMEVVVATGVQAAALVGLRYPARDSIASQAMEAGHGILVADVDSGSAPFVHLRPMVPVTQVMALPLKGDSGPRGAIFVGRVATTRAFEPTDLVMAEMFSGHAAIALELADARSNQLRISALEERDRIARDLHDHVIQRLFAAGLSVQSTAATVSDPVVRERLTRTVDDLDDTIQQIRTTIFALTDRETAAQTLRRRTLTLVEDLNAQLGLHASVTFSGPVDALLDDSFESDVTAVVREALTNASRHTQASTIVLSVRVGADTLTIAVDDNGSGLTGSGHRSGLANLEARARRRGGRLELSNRPTGGLSLAWTVPLEPRPGQEPPR